MKILSKVFTEEQLRNLTHDLDIARAKVYKQWGFSSQEIAILLDIPESQVRAGLSKEDKNA